MKTPEQVRAYQEQKRARSEAQQHAAIARREEEKKSYLAFVQRELDDLVDMAVDCGDVEESGGIIDIREFMVACAAGFHKFQGYNNQEFLHDVIAYFKDNKWDAVYTTKHTIYCGPEPSYEREGNFITFKPDKDSKK